MKNQTQVQEPSRDATRIVDGIEWFTIQRAVGAGISPQFTEDEDCQCARCGSSCDFARCDNCEHGLVEIDVGDGIEPDPQEVPCDWCNGTGGAWHCVSSPEWCAAHPLSGRAHIESTAMKPEAWRDA